MSDTTPTCTCPEGGCMALEPASMLMVERGRTSIVRRTGSVRCRLLEEHRAAKELEPAP